MDRGSKALSPKLFRFGERSWFRVEGASETPAPKPLGPIEAAGTFMTSLAVAPMSTMIPLIRASV